MPERVAGDPAVKPLALSATGFTHQGAVRPGNEDTIAIDDWVMSAPMIAPMTLERIVTAPTVCLVADGLGGHAGGDVASRFVAECLAGRAPGAAAAAALADLLCAIDAELFELMRAQPALQGMGSTVAGLHVAPSALHVFNVGDSRVYRIDDTGLVQLSTDDTPGPKLADGRTAARTTPLISQCLGGWDAQLTPHLLAEPIIDGHRYLICSDGLSDLLDIEAIAGHIEPSDVASVTTLFEAAMARGGRDNISIVMVRLRQA